MDTFLQVMRIKTLQRISNFSLWHVVYYLKSIGSLGSILSPPACLGELKNLVKASTALSGDTMLPKKLLV